MYLGDGTLSTFKTRGIILKTQDYKESDKLVWIFTEKLGKISAIAKGAKRSKSKHMSLTLPFCFGDYMVFRGKNLYTLSEGEIINSFQDLLNNLDNLTYASYLCELVDIALQDEESDRELFKEFVSAMYLLSSKAVDSNLLLRSFEVKILMHTGYGISSIYEHNNESAINKATYNILNFLSKASIDKITRITLPKNVHDELYDVLSNAIANNYRRKPKSLEIFNYFKESERNE